MDVVLDVGRIKPGIRKVRSKLKHTRIYLKLVISKSISSIVMFLVFKNCLLTNFVSKNLGMLMMIEVRTEGKM